MSETFSYRPVHPFPARMAPSIALDELQKFGNRPLRVLDPMVGSGTTLVAARSLGHKAYGFDTDPLALLIADVWSANINEKSVISCANKVFDQASKDWKKIRGADAYPLGCDDETKAFVRFWFDLKNRRQLRALADAISNVNDSKSRKVLWCAFSRLIIAKKNGASLAMDLSHSRPHKVAGKVVIRPIDHFLAATRTIIKNAPFQGMNINPKSIVRRGDARSIPLPDASIDTVITSPPYLNAIDYLRCNKFSLIWMGHLIPSIRSLRSSNIGSEKSSNIELADDQIKKIVAAMGNIDLLSGKQIGMLARYVKDMDLVIREIRRVLVKNGKCVMVVGDCNINGVFISNSQAFEKLGKHYGLKMISMKKRPLQTNRRYLPPPTSKTAGKSFQGRMSEEIVLTLQAI